MKIDVRYAVAPQVLPLPDGGSVVVRQGEHFPADDPLVRLHPAAFSDDPRFGMRWTGPAPAYMSLPPGEDAPQPSARGRRGE